MHALEPNLRAGIQALGLALSDAQVAQLLAYMDLIQKWTKVYNLTAVRDPAEMLTHHLLDSLAVVSPLQRQLAGLIGAVQSEELGDRQGEGVGAWRGDEVGVRQSEGAERFAPCPPPAMQAPPLPAQNAQPPRSALVGASSANTQRPGEPMGSAQVKEETAQRSGDTEQSPWAPPADLSGAKQNTNIRLLDVGSGAGLPGVVIAICCPSVTVHCVDTVAKKAAFIQQVAVTLKLPNLRGIHARVESLTDTYDVVSSRAFASLVDFVTWSHRALAEQGVWMAMKGKHPADEMAALPGFAQVFHVEQLEVPGLGAERCIVWMRRAAAHSHR